MIIPLSTARAAREIRATVRLALPLIAGQLAAIGMNVVDAVLAGHYNAHMLAAVAVGASIWSLALVCGIGVMMAVPPSVAQLDGAGRRLQIGPLFRQALWLALAAGRAAVVRACAMPAPLIASDRRDAESARRRAALPAGDQLGRAGADACYFALRGLSEGLSLTRPTMYFGLAGLVRSMPLGYVLMFGKLGFPPQGAHGCGMATAIVLWLELLAFGAYVDLPPQLSRAGPVRVVSNGRIRARIGAVAHRPADGGDPAGRSRAVRRSPHC